MLGSSRQERFSLQVLQVFDAGVVWLAFFVASLFRNFVKNVEGFDMGAVIWLLYIVVPFTPLILELFGFYRNPIRKKVSTALVQLFKSIVIIASVVGACIILFKLSQGRMLIIGMSLAGVLLFFRFLLLQYCLRKKVQEGAKKERILVAGTDLDIEKFLSEMPHSVTDYWEIVGVHDLTSGDMDGLEKKLTVFSVQRVLFTAQHVIFKEISEAVEVCENHGVEVWVSASFIRTQISRPVFDTLGGSPMLVFKSTPELSWSLLAKSSIDRFGALTIIVMTLPFWIFAYIGIKISSPGPAFFMQDRAGKYGRSFRMRKFRTMVIDAEVKLAEVKAQQGNEMDGPVFKLKDDPRVFKFAKLLRKFSIDELPQLINVLFGDMSLVGPRPLPVYEVMKFKKSTYRRRMSVKPGITCTWQVGGRNSITNFDDWVELDLEYIDNWSLWYDIKILLKTVPSVLFGSGAK